MLVLARKKNERILIGDQIEISVVEVKGDQVKLGIVAPRNVSVYRHEVYEAIQQENLEASKAAASLSLPDFMNLSGAGDASGTDGVANAGEADGVDTETN